MAREPSVGADPGPAWRRLWPLALLAAGMIFWLGDGPHLKRRHDAPPLRLGRVFYAFSIREFRASALGYFGHQWELYAFWTLVPALVPDEAPVSSPLRWHAASIDAMNTGTASNAIQR